MAGHVSPQNVLGTIEYNEDHFDQVYRHWMMAAKEGCTDSLKEGGEIKSHRHKGPYGGEVNFGPDGMFDAML
eukprot:1942675-Ditylum_brightwellii.AAC.1